MILDIGKVIYEQEAFNFNNWIYGYKMNPQILPQAVTNFLKLLDETETEVVLVGAMAMLAYVKDRNTYDLDLVISPHDFQKISWFVEVIRDERDDDDFINCLTQDGLRVDFLLTTNHIFDLVFKEFSQKIEFAQGSLKTATPEGLVLMKLYALAELRLRVQIFDDLAAKRKMRQYGKDILNLLDEYKVDLPLLMRLLEKSITSAQIADLDIWLEKNSNE